MDFISMLRESCRRNPQRVIFSDGYDERVLAAARYLKDNTLAQPVILGGGFEIRDLADVHKINTRGLSIINHKNSVHLNPLVDRIVKYRTTADRVQIESELKIPLSFAIEKVKLQQADFVLSGNSDTMRNVAAAALTRAGIDKDYHRISSFYLLFSADMKKMMAFADCSININPTAGHLAEIAVKTAENFEKITGTQARVALLSFSTKGSAGHPKVDLVVNALGMIQKMKPQLIVDGELQFDAAIDPSIAQKKAPKGSLNGKANVFIFPSLNAANIGQKIAEQVAGYISIGPMLQGTKYSLHHLAKSCTVEGIINSTLLASYMKIKNIH